MEDLLYKMELKNQQSKGLRDKFLVFVCRDFVFVLVLVVYLYEINYPDLSDCLYLL